MLRAAARAESVGIPSVSLVCRGFEGLSNATAEGVGYPGLPLAVLAGHVDTQTSEELLQSLRSVTISQIVAGLSIETSAARNRPTKAEAGAEQDDQSATEPVRLTEVVSPTKIVASGSINDLNTIFCDNQWSEGLPIIPPTLIAVSNFLATAEELASDSHRPLVSDSARPFVMDTTSWHQSLGTIKPSGREVTPWSIAVNGVMAGCQPQHMPVLMSLAQILLDENYGVEHSGNTTGADALIVVSGQGAQSLGFGSGQGALREGARANTAVGRWLRLYLRNVAGFLPGGHDKATFGNSTRVVLVEDDGALDELGWKCLGADLAGGSSRNQSAIEPRSDWVSLGRFNSGVIIGSVVGSSPEQILPYLADGLIRVSSWELTHVYGLGQGHYRPLLVLSPMLARVFGHAGWSKDDVRDALFETARINANTFERYIGEWSNLTAGRRTLQDLAAFRKLPKVFGRSADPSRLVPIVTDPSKFLLAVAGDPDRANAFAMSNDGPHGYPTSRIIGQ